MVRIGALSDQLTQNSSFFFYFCNQNIFLFFFMEDRKYAGSDFTN